MALDAAMQCFWARGFEATSMRELAESMGISGASLYNTFGDKRALYGRALEYYLECSVRDRIHRMDNGRKPRDAIAGFFDEIIARSLTDKRRRGCMLVNSALEMAPYDSEMRAVVVEELRQIEAFFRRCIARGQGDGTIHPSRAAEELAQCFIGVLIGLRVIARIRPERPALEAIVAPALSMLDHPDATPAAAPAKT